MRIVGARGTRRAIVTLIASVILAAPVDAAEVRRAPGTRASRSREEVEALVKKVGPTTPGWWAEVRLAYPSTLDLSWPEPPPTKDWDPSRNVGQYIWSVIDENPSRWREGVKFLHHLLVVHKDDRVKLRRTMVALGRMYNDLLEDFPRAAFWWRKAIALQGADRNLQLSLADCYWKLGSRDMAVDAISGLSTDFTRNGNLIKLWSDLGETDKALRLAEAKARSGLPDVGWLCAADA